MQAFEATLGSRLLVVQVVLELFAGSCRFSSAASRSGELVISLDIRFGHDHDLTRQKVQNLVLGWVQAGFIKFLIAGFPCQSLSRARNIPGGPPALRSAAHPTGIPGLQPVDAAKVALGNACLDFVVKLGRACRLSRIPAAFENPWSSWAWE